LKLFFLITSSNYKAPGNFVGGNNFKNNVLKPKSKVRSFYLYFYSNIFLKKLFEKAPSQSFTSCQKIFQEQILKEHNTYRAKHGAPRMNTDTNVQRTAQAYADKLASQNIFKHSGVQGLGENLAMSGSFLKLLSDKDCKSKIIQEITYL
jgi:hypothetical protein